MNIKTNSIYVPTVSIIMPAYNAERFIKEAICSVVSQTYNNWELWVIDDGSIDSTCAIVQNLSENDDRIKLVKNPSNMGVAKTRNRGLDLCNGNYVAFLDSDDVWHSDKLSEQIRIMRSTNAEIVCSSYAIVDAEGTPSKKAYIVPENISLDELLKENYIGCSTVMLSNEIAQQYRFKTSFYHEDYCLWLDILQDGYKAVGCTDVLVDWRLIQNSRSYNKINSAKNRWKIYRKHMNYSFLKSTKLLFCYIYSGIKKYYG